MARIMSSLLRAGLIAVSAVMIIFLARCEATSSEGAAADIPQGWKLLPRVGLSVEYGGYLVQQDSFASMLLRRLEIDILQYRRHIFYLNFYEKTFFGTPSDRWDFNLMKYDINLAGYRYDFGNAYLGLFLHHQCNNPFLTEKYRVLVNRERANIYDVGLEFLTKTMRLGMKDRGINFDSPRAFEFLGRFAGGASASRVVYVQNFKLDWILTGKLRCDLFRYRRLVPYVEVAGILWGGPQTRLAPEVEVGTRYHLSKVDITPFFKWERAQEPVTVALPEKGRFLAKHSLYGGARVEVLLDADTFPPSSGEGLQWFPEIHGNADYALHLRQQYFKGHGNVELDFEVLRWNCWTSFFYTDMNFNSRKEDFKPDKVIYWLQYGLTYARGRYFAEGFVLNQQRLDASHFRKTQERANLAGLRLGTKGMKPGHYNDGINFAGPTFQWLNLLNGQVSGGHYFQNRDWQYLWNVKLQARWDVLRWRFVIPYLQGEIDWQAGGGRTGDTLDFAVEPGLRFHGVLDLALYYRFQHWNNTLFFRGPYNDESLVGIRVLF